MQVSVGMDSLAQLYTDRPCYYHCGRQRIVITVMQLQPHKILLKMSWKEEISCLSQRCGTIANELLFRLVCVC